MGKEELSQLPGVQARRSGAPPERRKSLEARLKEEAARLAQAAAEAEAAELRARLVEQTALAEGLQAQAAVAARVHGGAADVVRRTS